jgi:hypothetical protein
VPAPMRSWHESLTKSVANRVELHGNVRNTDIGLALQRAQISLCTSLTESYHTVSAEALCCGCSIIGPDCPEVPSMKWFATEPHGRIARRETTTMVEAIQHELTAWDNGQRNPITISQKWGATLHAPNVATAILNKCLERNSPAPASDATRQPPK